MQDNPPPTGEATTRLRRRSPYLGSNSQILDPKTDVVFKLLFAAEKSRHLLIRLLTAVLRPSSPIVEVRVLNPEIEPSEYGDKRAVLDILAVFADGTYVDIEMQSRPHVAIEERLVFYWAKTYVSQLGSGDPHKLLRPVIGIYFLDFVRLPTARRHSTFHIKEDHEGFALTDALEFHFMELPKYALESPCGEPTDELVYWCKFLAAETEAEQEALAMANPNILETKTRLCELSQDPKARKLAEDRILWEWAYYQDVDRAKRLGREEGLRDGREEGRQDGLRDGILTAIVSLCDVLGLDLTDDRKAKLGCSSLKELESILESLRRERVWPE